MLNINRLFLHPEYLNSWLGLQPTLWSIRLLQQEKKPLIIVFNFRQQG